MEQLYSSLSNAISGVTTHFIISGEAGIGKTKIVEEIERTARRLDVVVLKVGCLSGYGYANQPFMDIMNKIKPLLHTLSFDKDDLIVISNYERNIDSSTEILSAEDPISHRPEGLLFLFLDLIRFICRKKPTILIIEDLHWADSSSVQLFFNIVRNLKKERLMFIVTYRPEELSAKDGQDSNLTEILNALKRENNVLCMDLKGLSLSDTNQLLVNYFQDTLDDRVTMRVVKESGGNPLFALETARLLLEATPETSNYLDSLDGYAIPMAVKDAIDRRLKRLDDDNRKCLECASIIGPQIDLDILAELVDRNKLSIIDVLDRLCRERSLLIERENVFLFSHDKIRQAILESMTVNRRMELNRMVGNILERRSIDESSAARLSYHFFIAGDRPKIVKYSYLAGDYYLRRSAAMEAITYFERALNNIDAEDDLKDIILEKKGDAFKDVGNFDEAMNSYSLLLEKTGSIPKARILRKTAELYVPTRLGKGGATIALKMLDQAEKDDIDDPYEKGEIASDRATLELWMGNPKEALRYCEIAERMFNQAGTELRLALEKIEHSTVLVSTGNICECLSKLNEVLKVTGKNSNPYIEIAAHQCLGMAYLHIGSFSDVMNEEDLSLEISTALDLHYFSCWSHLFKSYAQLLDQNEDLATNEADMALEFAEMSGSLYQRAGCLAMKAMMLNRTGKRDEAVQHLIRAEELMKSFDWVIKTPMHGLILLSQAELAVGISDSDSIDGLYWNAIDEFQDNTWGYFYSLFAHILASDSMYHRAEFQMASSHLQELLVISEKICNFTIYEKAFKVLRSTELA